jgi:hypothetical protein
MIVVPASLEHTLCCHLRDWGVVNYSISEALNQPAPNSHVGQQVTKHVRIDAVVPDNILQTILKGLQQHFSTDPSVIYFVSDRWGGSSADLQEQKKQTSSREVVWGDYLITI